MVWQPWQHFCSTSFANFPRKNCGKFSKNSPSVLRSAFRLCPIPSVLVDERETGKTDESNQTHSIPGKCLSWQFICALIFLSVCMTVLCLLVFWSICRFVFWWVCNSVSPPGSYAFNKTLMRLERAILLPYIQFLNKSQCPSVSKLLSNLNTTQGLMSLTVAPPPVKQSIAGSLPPKAPYQQTPKLARK